VCDTTGDMTHLTWIQEDENGCHLEVYPRASNEVYMCGIGGSKYLNNEMLKKVCETNVFMCVCVYVCTRACVLLMDLRVCEMAGVNISIRRCSKWMSQRSFLDHKT